MGEVIPTPAHVNIKKEGINMPFKQFYGAAITGEDGSFFRITDREVMVYRTGKVTPRNVPLVAIVKDGWLDGFSELSEPERIKDQAIYFDRTSMTVYLTDLEA